MKWESHGSAFSHSSSSAGPGGKSEQYRLVLTYDNQLGPPSHDWPTDIWHLYETLPHPALIHPSNNMPSPWSPALIRVWRGSSKGPPCWRLRKNSRMRQECLLLFQEFYLRSRRQQWPLSCSADRLRCEDLPVAQEEIGKAAISETPSRVLLTKIRFLVSSSLLMQQFLLSCHAY